MDNICCAPIVNGKRCSNYSADYSLCRYHADKTRPLYLKYKKYEDRNKDLISISNYTDLDIYMLLKIYNRLNRSYELRIAHHTVSYVSKLWDDGHKFYLERLVYKMLECERELSAKFLTADKVEIPNYEEEETEEESYVPINDIVSIRKKNKEIVDHSHVWCDIVPKLIEENEMQTKRRHKMICLLCFNINKVIVEDFKEAQGEDVTLNESLLGTICAIVVIITLMKMRRDGYSKKSVDPRLFQGFRLQDLITGELKYLYEEDKAKRFLLALINHKENFVKDYLSSIIGSISDVVNYVLDENGVTIYKNPKHLC